MGGMVALEFAACHPDLVVSLVLAHTAARLSPQTRFILNFWESLKKSGVEREIEIRSQLPWLLPESFFTDTGTIDFVVKQQLEQLRVQSVSGFSFQVAACCAFDGRPYLKKISAPTLVLGAQDDRMVSGSDLEVLVGGIPLAESVLLENCGHLGFAIEPQRFNREVLSFLALHIA